MLDNEQEQYIDKLRINHPALEDSTLRRLLLEASWTPAQIDTAISRFHTGNAIPKPPPATQVVPEASEPLPTTAPAQTYTPSPTLTPTSSPTSHHTGKIVAIVAGAVVLLSALGAGGYFVFTKTALFGAPTLTNENILRTVVERLSGVQTASYSFETVLEVNPRETGAKPFTATAPVSAEVLVRYQRDQDRFRDAVKIQEELQEAYFDAGNYPKSLTALPVKPTDPLGQPYVYASGADGKSYTLSITFETPEAVDAAKGNIYGSSEESAQGAGKVVTVSSTDYIYSYGFEGKPSEPRIFGIYEMSEIETFLPANLAAKFTLDGTLDNSSDSPLNARLRIAGEASFEDASFAFDAEGIKMGTEYFGIVNKMPSFFGSLSQIRGKWIAVTEDDLRNYGYSAVIDEFLPAAENERAEQLKKDREQLKILIDTADKHNLVSIASEPVKEKIGDETLTKYKLSLNDKNMLAFYEDATAALASYEDDSLLIRDEKTIEYLKGEDSVRVFEYLRENLTITLWTDKRGYPAKVSFSLRYVPSAEARALKDKQINLSFNVALSNINEPVAVTQPENPMGFDAFMTEITGLTPEEIRFGIQETNIESIRRALGEYYVWSGAYPRTLTELTKVRKDVPKAASTPEEDVYVGIGDSSYFENLPFLKVVPTDTYNKKTFNYTSSGADYELRYQMKLPPYQKNKNPADYYRYPGNSAGWYYSDSYYSGTSESTLLVPRFEDGINIATKDRVSQTETETADSDDDGLSDSLERIFNTNPRESDSDTDGFSDLEELVSGSDPMGPGKLDFEYNYLF